MNWDKYFMIWFDKIGFNNVLNQTHDIGNTLCSSFAPVFYVICFEKCGSPSMHSNISASLANSFGCMHLLHLK